jgi:hypothetical protein
MRPIRSIVLNISSCLECPKHQLIQDPDPVDPEREEDVAVVCTLSPNPARDPASLLHSDQSPHRPVVTVCPPSLAEAQALIPDWCPLLHKVLFLAAPQ